MSPLIFGGTFNPPHIGHLRMAEEVVRAHEITKVLFVPANIPPHKSVGDLAPADHRLKMIEICCSGNKRFEVSDVEIKAGGPSYTVNTMERLIEYHGDSLYFLMGTDSLSEISSWKDYTRLFGLTNFIVVSRPGITFEKAWSDLPHTIRDKYDKGENGYQSKYSDRKIVKAPVVGLDISATTIREILKKGESARYLVIDEVLEYIKAKRLYGK